MDKFKIEKMTLSSLDEVMQIEALAYGQHHWSRESFIAEIDNRISTYNCAYNENRKMAGYMGLWKIIDEKKDKISEEEFKKYLYNDLPDIDFLIRTSGEMRVSNFMLWQLSYAELYFPRCYFPDFLEEEYDKALEEYTKRDRRFGGLNNE